MLSGLTQINPRYTDYHIFKHELQTEVSFNCIKKLPNILISHVISCVNTVSNLYTYLKNNRIMITIICT